MAIDLERVRNVRLAYEYKNLTELPDSIVSWIAVKGEPPYVEEYLLKINVRTYISPTELTDSCMVRVSINKDFPGPRGCPRITIEGQIPFHPDVYSNGVWNTGPYDCTEDIYSLIVRLINGLQYRPGFIWYMSPCNVKAAQWYKKNMDNRDMFPSDTIEIPE